MKKETLLYDQVMLAERLEDLRKGIDKYTLAELSKNIEAKTGVYISATQLGKYEKTELAERININNLIAIANFYDVSIDYLLGKSDSKRHNYTEQMTAKKFGLTDKSMKNLSNITKNSVFNNNEIKLKIVNYIIENNTFLTELTENILELYKATDYKNSNYEKQKDRKIFKYELQNIFSNFVDKSYEDLWENKSIKKTLLFETSKEIENMKRRNK